jgi:hypothetical protein
MGGGREVVEAGDGEGECGPGFGEVGEGEAGTIAVVAGVDEVVDWTGFVAFGVGVLVVVGEGSGLVWSYEGGDGPFEEGELFL